MTRVFKLLLPIFLSLCATSPASAQTAETPIPGKRIIVERNVDFYGSDLRSIFDTTFEACRAACLNDNACGAFTFNTRSASCFPKRDVTQREAYDGAISAVVKLTPAAQLIRARERADSLTFLTPDDLSQARSEAVAIATRHAPSGMPLPDMIDQAERAREKRDYVAALRWTGSAVSLSDRSDLWRDYAQDALVAKGQNSNQTNTLRRRALPAAINAYLRAPDRRAQAAALETMARALEDTGRGRSMIDTLRLAERLAPGDRISAALNDAINKYGFRITDHRVDSDSASPRICATLNEDLDRSVDYQPYVQMPGQSFSVEAVGRELCVEGIEHGQRYQVTFRAGLPSARGEGMVKDSTLAFYVKDRSEAVRFPGRAYVLPKTPDASLPIVTVNLTEVNLTLRRVGERNLRRMIEEDYFGKPLSNWAEEVFARELSEELWRGKGEVHSDLNQDVTTRLPMAEAIGDLPPGLYALQASFEGADPYETPAATQWFVISDIGLATMSGVDGLHVFARSLASADALEGLEISLVSRSNRTLATTTTDAAGYAHFDAGVVLGRGGAEPALLTAANGETDFGFLSLTDPEFDLSDRGVEGRAPAGPIDVFLATDRGAYRAGETIHATALSRDGKAKAIDALPLTAILTRPDGVEYSRNVSDGGIAGGHVFDLPVGPSAPRGTWRLNIHADVEAPPLATETLLVEDFLPERIDFDLSLPDAPIGLTDVPPLRVEARYLFGAVGANLPVEGEVLVRATDTLAAHPGYRFGRYDTPFSPVLSVLNSDRTDDQGISVLPVKFPDIPTVTKPVEAQFTVRVSEGSGRPVERRITRALTPSTPMIGIRSLDKGTVPEGSEAQFDLIAIDPDEALAPMRVKWTLNRVRTHYQWYSSYGNWNWEPMTRRERVASGDAMLSPDGPTRVAAGVNWGRYELVVERLDGDFTSSAVDFYAGWYAPADASATPDVLDVSLNKESYFPGETAELRLVPRYAGKALITVVSNRLIDMKVVDVADGENVIDLPVTDDWGAGAYVTASVVRPMDLAAGHNPARSLGLAHAAIDPGSARLLASFETPAEVRPRGPLEVALKVDGIEPGQTAYATIAAVDQGILNLTAYQPPDAPDYFFGQRKLGMGLRDLYGRLIDATNGQMGALRSGGDASAQMRMESPPPTEELVAYFSGPITVDADGYARARFDLPSFNGQVKLMAVVWSDTGVGAANADVLVRDPVVLTASLPRFLSPGDQSSLLLEFTHATGPSGRFPLSVTTGGVPVTALNAPAEINLSDGGSEALRLPLVAGDYAGLSTVTVSIDMPDGTQLTKKLNLPVQVSDPEVSRTSRFDLANASSFSLTSDIFDGLRPGTGRASLAIGPLARLDTPGLLASLDRYPYGCTEQTTSRALPLLYLDDVSVAMGLSEKKDLTTRIARAIDRVLSRQASSGGFGLWAPVDGDFWLDAYVSDFLSRAKAQGYDVPPIAFARALDNLRNRVNYAPDFDAEINNGGEDIAYALLVLAREGAASIGDLRYYADVKGDDFATALASAQLGAALALYGDQKRADAMFARAARQMAPEPTPQTDQIWRSDYGTRLRDAAGVLTLAVEAGSDVIDRDALTVRLAEHASRRSTQEAAWSLLAANALIQQTGNAGFLIDGQSVQGPLVRGFQDTNLTSPKVFENNSGTDTILTLTTFGVPTTPTPAGGKGYAITRAYYTMDGDPVDISTVAQGTRLVTVLTVQPFGYSEGRLMVDDPLPAGLEIDNPSLVRSGEISALNWLETADTRTAEFRQDRFLAAVDWRSSKAFRLAYVVRAISPGSYHHPAASVEDMYRPNFRAHSDPGRVTVTE